jgi:hypothetical protein
MCELLQFLYSLENNSILTETRKLSHVATFDVSVQEGMNLDVVPGSTGRAPPVRLSPSAALGLVRRPRVSGDARPPHATPSTLLLRGSARRFPKRIAIRLGLVSNHFVDPPEKPIFLPPTFAFDPSHPRALPALRILETGECPLPVPSLPPPTPICS